MKKPSEKATFFGLGIVSGLLGFLVLAYFANFVTEAAFLKRKGEVDTSIAVISTKLDGLKTGQEEIKKMIK